MKKELEKPAEQKAIVQSNKIGGKGFENLDRSDILLPRLVLLQPLSPQVVDAGEKPGTFFLNLQNKSVGAQLTITPVLHFRSRIKWNPKDEGGGVDCASPDAKAPRDTKYAQTCSACAFKEWDNTQKKKKDQFPKCTLYENFVVLLEGENEPVILPMWSTKAKIAKKFYSMMALKGGDMFDNSYRLSVTKDQNDEGESYFNFQVSDIGSKTDATRRAHCDGLWNALQKANITMETEHPESEGVAAEASGKF